MIENISKMISSKIALNLKMDKDHEEIIAYGAFNLIQILWCIILVIVFSSVFGVLEEALIITFTISLLRKYSGGAHASSPNRCAIIGTIVSVGFALIVQQVFSRFNSLAVIILGIISLMFSYYTVYRFAPVDSPAKPIKKIEKKQHLKKCSIIVLNILLGLIMILVFFHIKYRRSILLNIIECIYLAVLWQSFTLTTSGHTLFNKVNLVFEYIIRRTYHEK
ncbi:accessory gene regulator B family protein [Clostridium estertheticum]|uniref:accessory gene regulator ArgB-like protein n=1 Tax=Clostridium estertheticum TaxID=238834 RepID=UPI001CCF1498|nr:accessory gene regulator B family protein [Clostridium estertheticum]MBZ9609208.1 accessory gene regulator B family protein [Clostridium estertheticum]